MWVCGCVQHQLNGGIRQPQAAKVHTLTMLLYVLLLLLLLSRLHSPDGWRELSR
jgi:hypothetical protein